MFLLGAALVYAWTVKRPKVLAIGHLALVAMWVVALKFLLISAERIIFLTLRSIVR